MDTLDIKTIFVVMTLVNFAIGVIMLVIWKTQKVYPGFGNWAACNTTLFIMSFFIALRGKIPDFFSIVIANTLTIAACYLRLEGIRRFYGKQPYRYFGYFFTGIFFALLFYFTYFSDSMTIRTCILALGAAFCLLLAAYFLLFEKKGEFSAGRAYQNTINFFIAFFMISYSVIFLYRMIVWIENPQIRNLFFAAAVNSLFLIYSIVAEVSIAALLITLNGRRMSDELAAAKAEAEAASHAKSDFLARMSHEIRTPVNGLSGFLDLIDESAIPAAQKEFLSGARSSSRMLFCIINDILDISKIEAGKMDLEEIKFRPAELLESTARMYSAMATNKSIDFFLAIKNELPYETLGDPTRLRQIIGNLLNNSIKFTEKGSVELSAELVEERDDFGLIRFAVNDTGIGISPENAKNLFTAFQQADESINRNFGGTGLGLFISRQLAGLMGGVISFSSEPQKGSTFTFEAKFRISLRRREQTVHSENFMPERKKIDSPVVSKIFSGFAAAENSSPLKILLAEDSLSNRIVITNILKRAGFDCDQARDGNDAFESFSKKKHDIILMDCNMPEMDGYECTRKIRESGAAGRNARIIAITADAMKGTREKCIEAGMDDYISKPFEAETIVETIKKHGEKKEAANISVGPEFSNQCRNAFFEENAAQMTRQEMDETFDAFFISLDKFFREIHAGIETGDLKSVSRCAHQIKGSAGVLKLEELSRMAAELEKKSKAEDLAACRSIFSKMIEHLK